MHIVFSYQEASTLLKKKVGKDILLNYTNPTTINICYEAKVNTLFFGKKSKKINIDIIVDEVIEHDLYIHYATRVIAGDAIVRSLLGLIPVLHNIKAIETTKKSNLIVHLDEVSIIKNILKNISLHSISFDKNSIYLELTPIL